MVENTRNATHCVKRGDLVSDMVDCSATVLYYALWNCMYGMLMIWQKSTSNLAWQKNEWNDECNLWKGNEDGVGLWLLFMCN